MSFIAEVFKNRILANEQTLESVPEWIHDEVVSLLEQEQDSLDDDSSNEKGEDEE